MAEQKDTLEEWRKLVEQEVMLAEKAYDHARLLDKHDELIKLLAVVEAAKIMAEFQRGYEFLEGSAKSSLESFDAALAALEGEKGGGGR